MNYYNPQFFMPASFSVPKAGIFSRLFGGIKFSSILNGTQKVLNFTNQLIPVVKQVSPMIKNAKTMFKVMNEFKRTDNKINTSKEYDKNKPSKKEETTKTNYSNQGPTFFI